MIFKMHITILYVENILRVLGRNLCQVALKVNGKAGVAVMEFRLLCCDCRGTRVSPREYWAQASVSVKRWSLGGPCSVRPQRTKPAA